jgi:hypothetical protein
MFGLLKTGRPWIIVAALILTPACGSKEGTAPPKAVTGPSATRTGTPATPGKEGGPAAAPVSKEPAFNGKAEDFIKEFKDLASLKAGLEKYKDKYIEVEALVEEAPAVVALDKEPKMTLSYPGKTGFTTPFSCTMSPEAARTFYELGKGQKVKVNGKLDLAIVNVAYLSDCTYKAEGPSPVIKVSAKNLGAELSKDEDTAQKKYDSKELIVDGVVKELKETKDILGSDYLVKLEALHDKTVDCLLPETSYKKLKKGDKVVVKAKFGTLRSNNKLYPGLTTGSLVKKE